MDLAHAGDGLDPTLDDLGPAFRVEVDGNPGDMRTGFHDRLDGQAGHCFGPDDQGQVLARRIAAAAHVDMAQREGNVGGRVQQTAQLTGGLEQLRNQYAAVRCVDDRSAAALEVTESPAPVTIAGNRHLGPVPIALDLWRWQGRKDLLGTAAHLLVERLPEPAPFAFELFSIGLAKQGAGAALDTVRTVDGSCGGIVHLRVELIGFSAGTLPSLPNATSRFRRATPPEVATIAGSGADHTDRTPGGNRMKAVVFEEFGAPLKVAQVDDPVADDHGVVIKVEASGICRSDWHGWLGHDPDIRRFPHVPGHELAGIVEEIGSEVTAMEAGRSGHRALRLRLRHAAPSARAATTRSATTRPSRASPTGAPSPSTSRSTTPTVNLVALPDEMDFVTAASLGCRFATSFRAVARPGRACRRASGSPSTAAAASVSRPS